MIEREHPTSEQLMDDLIAEWEYLFNEDDLDFNFGPSTQ